MLAFAVFFSLLGFFKVAFRLTSQGHCSTAASQSRTVHTATSGQVKIKDNALTKSGKKNHLYL